MPNKLILVTSLFVGAFTTARAQSPAEDAPRTPWTLDSLVERGGDLVRRETIGSSRGGRDIDLLTLARADAGADLSMRPAILVVAGADGTRPIDTALALDQCRRLVEGAAASDSPESALLDSCVIYVVPTLNPDGAALGRVGNAAKLDLDRDGATDEDTPDDVDGDGLVSMMRWPAPDGAWIADADDPRLMREADTEEDGAGTHHFELEARDADDDDTRGEDPAQGIVIDRSFSHRFDEFDRSTGPFPMREPETRALADFVYAHRNIVLAFVWGRDDTLLETPKTAKPKARIQNEGILEGDESLYEKAGKLYRDKTGREGKGRARMDGSPWSWLYFQVGVPTFAADVWRPAALEDEEKKDPLRDARRRLAACEAAGRGFVEWHPFDHPQLGAVEIGGFVHEHETALLPDEQRDALFEAHHAFFLEATQWRADVRVASLTTESLAGGAFRVEARVVNDGDLPALTATGQRTRRFSIPRLTLRLDGQQLIAGRDRPRVRNLDARGGHEEFVWIVRGDPGSTVAVDLRVDPVGSMSKEVTL